MEWWRNAKFGLFIHFGLYSILGKGEWVMFEDQIDTAEYAKLMDKFDCRNFNAREWVEIAQSAGCRYMVVTARHHDGFSLFKTGFGNYDAPHSAAKEDLIAEYIGAAHRAGMRVGIYYSPLDWRYPGFFFPDLYRANAEQMKRQTYTQVRELLTNYGAVDILWYDGGEDNWLGFGGLTWSGGKGWQTRGFDKPYAGKFSWEPLRLNHMVRELQPKIVISQRSGWMGDFETQEVGFRGRPEAARPWELCTNLGGPAWGWVQSTTDHMMSLDSCIQLLVMVVSQGGNLLMNVGPRPDGSIEPKQVERLKGIGNFLAKYGESIYDTRGGIYDASWGGTTVSENAVYVHLLRVPADGTIHLPPITRKITAASYLRDASEVHWVQTESGILLEGISEEKREADLIIKLALR